MDQKQLNQTRQSALRGIKDGSSQDVQDLGILKEERKKNLIHKRREGSERFRRVGKDLF
jgi:hypothetical protein